MNIKKFAEKYLIYVILVIIGVIGYLIYSLFGNITVIKNNIFSVESKINDSVLDLDKKIVELQKGLEIVAKTNSELSQNLQAQQTKSDSIDQTLSGLAGTVNTLEKLSKTDRELLQKYSKVYFLNENYVPVQLSNIDQKYLQNKSASLQFHTVVMIFLTKMLDDASANSSAALVVSTYRSFGTQGTLKNSYRVTYGSGANAFSADQGYSEHQLGTTVDLTAPDINPALDIKFDSTPTYVWLTDNAYKYGFILSYPKNNSYYQYEPWHWRFVGVALATKLHNENKNFYNLDQREIDTYLSTIFDQLPL